MVDKHPNYGLYSGLGWENWWRYVVIDTFRQSHCIESTSLLNAVATELIKIFETSSCWTYNKGALDLLENLKTKNIKLGVISNFDPRLPVVLKQMKLDHYFQFIIYSYEVGIEKPNNKIFDKALQLSNFPGIVAKDAMHVGNSIDLDYYGATKAGWKAALISERPVIEITSVPSKYIFSSLNQFNNYLLETKII